MKKRKNKVLIICLIMTAFFTVPAYAALSDYDPAHSNDVKKLFNQRYTDAGGRKSIIQKSVIKPYNEQYRYGIHKYGSYKGSKKHGTEYSEKAVKKILKDFGKTNYPKQFYWFNLNKTKHPCVLYRGFCIWDEKEKRYVPLIIKAEIKDWTAAGKHRTVGDTRLVAMTNANCAAFDGLPTYILVGTGNVKVKYTFYKVRDPDAESEKWEAGGRYPLKSNVTYKDIDAFQAISISRDTSGGFTSRKAAPNLEFGKSGSYYAVSSGSGKDEETSNTAYWMSYDLKAKNGEVDMIYTTNQMKVNNSGTFGEKAASGPPSGYWTFFGTSTYDENIPVIMPDPEKHVYDSKSADDPDKVSNTHNKLTDPGQLFWYNVSQNIPPGLLARSDRELSELIFTDKLDTCISTAGTKDIKTGVKIKNGSGKDITDCFDIIVKKHSVTAKMIRPKESSDDSSAKIKKRNLIYNYSEGGHVTMTIYARITADEDAVDTHAGTDGKAHKQGVSNYADIPNIAAVTYKIKGKSQITKKTQEVRTRITSSKRNLIIKKKVSGEAPSKTKQFAFDITLNSGRGRKGIVTRADGTSENFTIKRNKIIRLAHGDVAVIKGLRDANSFTVTEIGTKRYTAGYKVETEGRSALESSEFSGSAAEGKSITAKNTIKKNAPESDIEYTFTNSRSSNHHDLKIAKEVEGENGENSFGFIVTLDRLAENTAYIIRKGNDERQVMSDSDGRLVINESLKGGERFIIKRLPDEAKYRIKERAAPGYLPSYKVTENPDKVTSSFSQAERSEPLISPKEIIKDTGEDYDLSYIVRNSKSEYHMLTVGKKINGDGADENDEFTFEADFSRIPHSQGQYHSFGAEKYHKSDGEKEVTESLQEKVISNDFYTEKFSLKSGESMTFGMIPEGVRCRITEKGNDYKASYERKTGPGPYETGSSDEYTDLESREYEMQGKSAEICYEFSNTRKKGPVYNSLTLKKETTDGSDNEFEFDLSFTGLEKNSLYAAVQNIGDNKYILVRDGNAMSIRTGRGTVTEPYRYIPGVPLKIIRNDGEEKYIFTDERGRAGLEEISDWIGYKGGDFSVRWAGGIYESALDNQTIFRGTISGFRSDERGMAVLSLAASNDTMSMIERLPEGASYNITESANYCRGEVTVSRNSEKIHHAKGKKNASLQSGVISFDDRGKKSDDSVVFKNISENHMLKTTKTVIGDQEKKFSLSAVISGLAKDWYMTMIPGEGDYEISMSETGDISIKADNYTGPLEDIPVKLIRPLDGQSKVIYTDEEGRISAGAFSGWLEKDQNSSFEFVLEWNGGSARGKFTA